MRFQFRNSCGSIREEHSYATEYTQVTDAFLSLLSDNATKVLMLRAQRVQNHELCQTFSAKRQSMLARPKSDAAPGEESARLEHKWLFHGTCANVLPQTIQQGFNRSFCGKNTTVYGKVNILLTAPKTCSKGTDLFVVTRVFTLLKMRVIQHPKLTPNPTIPEYNTYLHAG